MMGMDRRMEIMLVKVTPMGLDLGLGSAIFGWGSSEISQSVSPMGSSCVLIMSCYVFK